eukprot:1028109-Rhodomonas_salina.2
MQISSVTDIDAEKMVVTGLGNGALHDTADLVALGMREGHVLTVREGAVPAAAPPTNMERLLGNEIQLLKKDGTSITVAGLPKEGVIGLYFSAHWCPPCRGFTPKLAEAYNKIRSDGKALEIVFVSSDKDEGAFAAYHAEQPWLALPFAQRGLKNALSNMFEIKGIPSLVLLDAATGKTITKDGRQVISADPEGRNFPWKTAGAASAPAAGAGLNVNALAAALQQATQQKKTQQEVQREQGMAQMTSRIHRCHSWREMCRLWMQCCFSWLHLFDSSMHMREPVQHSWSVPANVQT